MAKAYSGPRGFNPTDATSIAAQRLEQIIAAADLGTWEWHVQTGEVVFNDRWAGMLGYTLAELSPLSIDTWVQVVHPDDLAASNHHLQQHFEGLSDEFSCECRLRHKDGYWIWVRTHGRIVARDAQNRPLLMYGTHTDITPQKRAFDDLRRSERCYELAAMASGSALYDWDTYTDELIWRGRAWEIMGATGNQDLPLTSRDFEPWVHPDDRALYRDALRSYFKRESGVLCDVMRLLRPDGSIMWAEFRGVAHWDATGRARQLFGSLTDVSARHRSDQTLASARSLLTDKIAGLRALNIDADARKLLDEMQRIVDTGA